MGTSQNWLRALEETVNVREEDMAAHYMRLREVLPPKIVAAIERNAVFVDPDVERDPAFRTVEELMRGEMERWPPAGGWAEAHAAATRIDPDVCEIYLRIRTALWNWPEFAGLTRGARAILEAVIELARDERFPWYLPVPAEVVRALARLTEGSFQRSVRELDCLAVTRDAAMYRPADHVGADDIAFMEGRLDEVPRDAPSPAISQFVLKYRRGIPWNRKRAAWWINYDLLCETGFMLPMFDANLRRLPVPYVHRNLERASAIGEPFSASWVQAQREQVSQNGPLMPMGSRAPLWRMPKATADTAVDCSPR